MTEAEWLAHEEPETMLRYLGKTPGDRKLRLFACACCRRVGHLITNEQCGAAVEIAERFADALVGVDQLKAARKAAENGKSLYANASWAAAWATVPEATMAAEESSLIIALTVGAVAAEPAKSRAEAANCAGAPDDQRQEAWQQFEAILHAASMEESRHQANLLRDIVGNPFQAQPVVGPFTSTVLQLAESMYGGEDCLFALHDALVETGHEELARHFLEGEHPKGCWVVDAILARKTFVD